MGSGVSGLYSGTYGANMAAESARTNTNSIGNSSKRNSQPYASSYEVTPDMLQRDRDRGTYSDKSGYARNPTAVNAYDNVHDGVLVDHNGKPLNGNYTYVVKENGELVIGKRNGNGRDGKETPHPTLVGGRRPRVKVAGMVTISNGKIVKYDNESGHFKPNDLSLPEADKAFAQLPKSAFHRNFHKNMNRR